MGHTTECAWYGIYISVYRLWFAGNHFFDALYFCHLCFQLDFYKGPVKSKNR